MSDITSRWVTGKSTFHVSFRAVAKIKERFHFRVGLDSVYTGPILIGSCKDHEASKHSSKVRTARLTWKMGGNGTVQPHSGISPPFRSMDFIQTVRC